MAKLNYAKFYMTVVTSDCFVSLGIPENKGRGRVGNKRILEREGEEAEEEDKILLETAMAQNRFDSN